MSEPFEVVLTALPDHIEFSELVHDAEALVRQREHLLAAGIFFEDHVFRHQPVPDDGGIRLDGQRQRLQINGL